MIYVLYNRKLKTIIKIIIKISRIKISKLLKILIYLKSKFNKHNFFSLHIT